MAGPAHVSHQRGGKAIDRVHMHNGPPAIRQALDCAANRGAGRKLDFTDLRR
jgi:hypothetical protein